MRIRGMVELHDGEGHVVKKLLQVNSTTTEEMTAEFQAEALKTISKVAKEGLRDLEWERRQ
jgi:hypothetical protein